MSNALYPSYVRIEYHSPFAPHLMTLPTLQWDPGGYDSGEFLCHDTTFVEADVMIKGLVNQMAEIFTDDVVFDQYQIFSSTDPEIDPLPQYGAALAIPGINASTAWFKAVEQIFTARTTLFGVAKLTLLDVPTNNDFNRVTTLSGEYSVLFNIWSGEDTGWAGRDNGRPATFLQATANLNEALRRAYRMT